MDYILANATVFVHGKFMKSNVFIANGMIHEISNRTPQADCSVYDLNGCFVFPGFIDVHVHQWLVQGKDQRHDSTYY